MSDHVDDEMKEGSSSGGEEHMEIGEKEEKLKKQIFLRSLCPQKLMMLRSKMDQLVFGILPFISFKKAKNLTTIQQRKKKKNEERKKKS
jgi:hypothetical protein